MTAVPEAGRSGEAGKVPTGPYVERIIRIFRDKPHDDTSALVLIDYANARLAAAPQQPADAVPDALLWKAIDEAKDPADFLQRAIALLQTPTHVAPKRAAPQQPPPVGVTDANRLLDAYDDAVQELYGDQETGWNAGGCRAVYMRRIRRLRAIILRRLSHQQPAPSVSEAYCSGCDNNRQVLANEADENDDMLIPCPDCRPPAPSVSLQQGVTAWMGDCFPPNIIHDRTERGDRLLEEVLELLQSHGYDRGRVATLVDYVYGRPVGEPAQEVGGVMVTLAAYCMVAGLDMHAEGDRELARIVQPEVMAKIRRKQEAKNALHFDTPLPCVTDWADRLQSAHDAEVGALRAELSTRGDYVNEQLLSRLREAEGDARRYRWLRVHGREIGWFEDMRHDEGARAVLDAAIDRAMEGEDG